MKVKFILVLALLLLGSCSKERKKEITENSFNQKIEIVDYEKILQHEYFTTRFINVDSLLVIQTKLDTALFKVYDSKTLKFKGSFGKKGDGPNEFSYPYFSGQTETSNELKFYINDLWKNEFSLINISKSLDSNKVVFDKKIKINPKYDFTHDLIMLNDSIFYGNHGFLAIERHRLSKYNLDVDILTNAKLIPELENLSLIKRGDLYKLYFDQLLLSPDKTKLVSAMYNFNRLDFYDLDLNLIKVVEDESPKKITDAKDIFDNQGKYLINLRNYYQNMFPTKNYIFALHRKGQLETENGKKDIKVNIRVFDWDGNPLFLLKIPHDLTSISIDSKNNWIYGIDSNNESLYRYKYNF